MGCVLIRIRNETNQLGVAATLGFEDRHRRAVFVSDLKRVEERDVCSASASFIFVAKIRAKNDSRDPASVGSLRLWRRRGHRLSCKHA